MKIEVAGKVFTIQFVDNWKLVTHDPDNCPRHAAEIHWVTSNIRVDDSRDISSVEISLWHEVIHAITDSLKIRELMDEDGNCLEIPTDQLAIGIASVLKSVGLSLVEAVKNVE